MDEFLKDTEIQQEVSQDNEIKADALDLQQPAEEAEQQHRLEKPIENIAPVYNPVNYTPVEPINDYKPMSKGLKAFSVVMALIIALTAASTVGYFIGKDSAKSVYSSSVKVDLAARPKNTDQMTEAEVYEKVDKSIVGIVVYNSSAQSSQASGIVYSEDGYVITNDHIYSEIPAPKFKIYAYDGTEYDATYVAGDKVSDLAILKIKNAKLEPAVFGDSDEIFSGEQVVAIGRPYDATDASSITRGLISAVSRRMQTTTSYSARLIQTDCTINPGSSGGALVNMYGQVVGVTSSKLTNDYEGVGYAIPTTTMKRIAEELIKNKRVVSRAKLGVTYTAIDSIIAELKGYKNTGLLISSVDEESGLYGKAEEGDVITHINSIKITNDDIVLDIIEKKSAGDKITVTVVKTNGTTKEYEVELKANISESSYTDTEIVEVEPDDDELEPLPKDDSEENGGIFNFPFGE